jgi:hypothetical protein
MQKQPQNETPLAKDQMLTTYLVPDGRQIDTFTKRTSEQKEANKTSGVGHIR